jgi:two-component system cell cycle sensor histidine kinase/response regulator CckA
MTSAALPRVRPPRLNAAGRLIILALALAGVVAGLALVHGDWAEPFILGLLALLAAVGVSSLFAVAIGLLRLGARRNVGPMTDAVLDSLSQGIVVADGQGRILYANGAYARLTGSADGQAVRGVDRVFSADPQGADAIYRLVRALRDGRSAEEEVRMPAASDNAVAASTQPRWFRITARPMPVEGERGQTVWTVADISRERADHSYSFQGLRTVPS